MKRDDLFWELYRCPVEDHVTNALDKYGLLNSPENWKPYGGNENNFGVVENQQASPIPALVEKVTNGIDAILEKRCLEDGIDPKSDQAPRSIEDGVATFFPDHSNWDLGKSRRIQAETLQILADGPRLETSLIIYDDGIGQRPEDFENTFLSLLRGNKNEIHFVQGKYNMGGAGAVAFCGKHRFQLIASKYFDGSADFGFTLVRRHPLTKLEEHTKKNTWYEYLILDGQIPSFPIRRLKLGLRNREFSTGTVIKLYSYQLPSGSRSVISRDLNQSVNEYLFSPALPLFTIDRKDRYPDDRNLERDLFGLKRRLEEDNSRFVECFFSVEVNEKSLGRIRIYCYVFAPRIDKLSAKDTQTAIRREFFKNNMSVLFSINGQVHGHYTSEFISRTLKFQLLKDHLLIHVDCTDVRTEVRNELFMASRDRLKEGEESRNLRHKLGEVLGQGRLKEINKRRKVSLTVEEDDAQEMLRQMTHNLPIKENIANLLNQTFKLDDPRIGKKERKQKKKSQPKHGQEKPIFSPQRYPSTFRIEEKERDAVGTPLVSLPLGGSGTIKFSTDVEDQYFDRVQKPGELQVKLWDATPNKDGGGDDSVPPRGIEDVLNVVKSSPSEGTIRIHIKPTKEVAVGDAMRLQADLSSPNGTLTEIFMVKITEPNKKSKTDQPGDDPDPRLGLPTPVMVYKNQKAGTGDSALTWDALEEKGIEMDHAIVVKPLADGDCLSDVYINMDSAALLDFRGKLKSPEQISIAEKRYFSAVYFHTLFLYAITKSGNYLIHRGQEGERQEDVDITDYISDLFRSAYAQFLLNFDTQEIISAFEA